MERRVRGNSHARCGVGEKLEIISKAYLSLQQVLLHQISQLQETEEIDAPTKPWIENLLQIGKLEELDRVTLAQTVKEIRVFEENRIEIQYLFSEALRSILEQDAMNV